jgi:hypothetical protein
MGYILEDNEEFVDFIGLEEVTDGPGGFILAISSSGINAMSFVTAMGRVTD